MASSARLRPTRYPHLFTRGRIFYFRMSLPGTIRYDVCVSLGTTDATLAKVLATKIKTALLSAMSHDAPIDLSNPETRAKLREIAREYCQREVEKLNELIELHENTNEWNLDELVTDTRNEIEQATTQLKAAKFPRSVVGAVEQLLADRLPEGSSNPEIQNNLKKYLLRAQIEANRVFLAKLTADYHKLNQQDELFTGIELDALPPIPVFDIQTGAIIQPKAATDPKQQLLVEVIQDYLDLKTSQKMDKKTVRDIALSLKAFQLARPDIKRMSDITAKVLSDFELRLSHFPARFSSKKEFAGADYEKLKVLAVKSPKLSDASFDKYMMNVRTFINWCMEQELVGNWKIPSYKQRDKTSAKDKRHPFTDDELKKFLTSPQYTGHQPDGTYKRRHLTGSIITKDYLYWVPLVSLYSGMRLGEVYQLRVEDIKAVGDITYMDVNDEGDKKTKNAASKRKVPIHPELVRLGFMDVIASAQKRGKAIRIFHDSPLAKEGSVGDVFSKKFGRYLAQIKIKHSKLVFHSFRHTFIDWAYKRCGVDEHRLKALVGHGEDTVTFKTYGGDFTLEQLNEAMVKVKYQIKL